MNRRRFLEMLTAGAFGALTLDVDKLLWVPGARTIFIPPPTRNTVLTIDWIVKESLRILARDLKFQTVVKRDCCGPLPSQLGVDLVAAEKGMSPRDYSARFIEPAMACVASELNHTRKGTFTPLTIPRTVTGAVATSDTASVRVVNFYDLETGKAITRFDVQVS